MATTRKKFELGMKVDEIARGMSFNEGLVVHSMREINGQYLLEVVRRCKKGEYHPTARQLNPEDDLNVVSYALQARNGKIVDFVRRFEDLKMQTCTSPSENGLMMTCLAHRDMSQDFHEYEQTLRLAEEALAA